MQNKFKHSLWLLVFGLWLATRPVLAITPTVSIQDLPSYVTVDNFKLSCSALGGSNIQFAYKKEGGSYQNFGGVIDITTDPCQVQVGSSQINEQTKYHFKVILDGNVNDETSTTYDVAGPSPVTDYGKDSGGNNNVVIHWKNPNSEDLAKVIIYRGETVDFSADSNHEITTVNGTPNSEMTYTTDIPDNTKTYYYSLRAVDKAGNSSSLVGDGSATITTTIATQAQSENGVSEVRQLPKETNGQVLGEDRVEGPDLESTQTPSLSGIIANVTKNKPWLFVGGALLILGIAVYLFKRNK